MKIGRKCTTFEVEVPNKEQDLRESRKKVVDEDVLDLDLMPGDAVDHSIKGIGISATIISG